jgi:biopolymer transport protein ExbD
MAVNMTPLIDVVFLIIIFFIIMINFSEMHIRKLDLPKADETQESTVPKLLKISLTIKSKDMVLLDRTKIQLSQLDRLRQIKTGLPRDLCVLIQAEAKVPYGVIKKAMQQLSLANVQKIEFSTLKGKPSPLQ